MLYMHKHACITTETSAHASVINNLKMARYKQEDFLLFFSAKLSLCHGVMKRAGSFPPSSTRVNDVTGSSAGRTQDHFARQIPETNLNDAIVRRDISD